MGLRTALGLKPVPWSAWRQWYAEKEFTSDWLTEKLPSWIATLAPFRETAKDILDVGAYEGRSAIAFLELCPGATVTSIDIFSDPLVEARFDRNLMPYGRRLLKLKGRALSALDRLYDNGRQFDIVYLDAAKRRTETLAQSVLAWSLLREGGILIWDDVRWKPHLPDAQRPGPGIELFAATFAGCYERLHRDRQLIVRKSAEWPNPPVGA